MTADWRLRLRAAAHEVGCAECRVSWGSWASRLVPPRSWGGVVRLELRAEWRPGYSPRLRIRRAPRAGDRVVDGGVPGVLATCRECGDGLLHQPDHFCSCPAAEVDGSLHMGWDPRCPIHRRDDPSRDEPSEAAL